MKYRIILIALQVGLILLIANSQEVETNSLVEKEIDELYENAYRHINDPNISIPLLERQITLSKETNNQIALANALFLKAFILRDNQKPIEAIDSYFESLKHYLADSDKQQIISTFQNIANIYYDLYDYQTALMLYKEALDFTNKLGRKDSTFQINSLASTNHSIGLCFKKLNNSDSASAYLRTALHLYKRLNDIENEARIYIVMGSLKSKNDSLEALRYFNKALKISNKLHSADVMGAMAYNNLGNYYFNSQDFINAKHYFKLAHKLKNNLSHENRMIIVNNLGKISLEENNLELALKYFKVNEINEIGLGEVKQLVISYEGQVKAYQVLNNETKVNYYKDKIITELRPLVDLVDELKIKNTQFQLWRVKYEHERRNRELEISKKFFINQVITWNLAGLLVISLAVLIYQYHKRKQWQYQVKTFVSRANDKTKRISRDFLLLWEELTHYKSP